jgi:hypothetical protein
MTLPRNRNVGSLADIDRGHARFDDPTSNPRLLPKNQQNRSASSRIVLKIRAEWIRAGKFASEAHAETWMDPAAPRLRRALQCQSAEALAKAGKPGHDGMAGGVRRGSADGITMTTAAKIVVAKSRPRASNRSN